jgi:DNA-binding IclR family transcriptional regulator
MPFMEDVHGVVGQHVQLGVREGTEVLVVERLSAPGAVANVTRIAGRLSLHASSAGLVLLAFAPADVQEAVLAGRLRRYTPRTITTARRLRTVLADVRRTGAVVCPGYIHLDAAGSRCRCETARAWSTRSASQVGRSSDQNQGRDHRIRQHRH